MPRQPVTHRDIALTAPGTSGAEGVSITDQTPRVHIPISRIVEALADPSQTNGALLVGLKEASAVRGVTDAGVELPRSARLVAGGAIREAFPDLHIEVGIDRPFHIFDGTQIRADTIRRTYITTRPPADPEFLATLRAHPNVDYIEPNWTNAVLLDTDTPLHEAFSAGSSAVQAEPWSVAAVRANIVWDDGYRGDSVTVGVADTGADIPFGNIHPDLELSSGFLFGQFVDHRSNNPCDSTQFGQACWYEEPYHGTGVLGSLIAADNSVGSVGVAPGGSVDYAVIAKVAYWTSGGSVGLEEQDFADGVKWINQNYDSLPTASPLRLAVTSVAYGQADTTEHTTLRQAFSYRSGDDMVLWFAGVGNASQNFAYVPAAFGRVVGVGSVDSTLSRAASSHTGTNLELVAPGVALRISWNRADDDSGDHEFTRLRSGTSYAAPNAAAVARLALEKYPSWSASQLRQKLQEHTRDLGSSDEYGYGMVDAVCLTHQLTTCNPIKGAIEGPNNIQEEDFYTWAAIPGGGDGSFTYAWEYCPSFTDCESVGTDSTYTRFVEEEGPHFELRVTISSSDEIPAEPRRSIFNNIGGPEETPIRPRGPGAIGTLPLEQDLGAAVPAQAGGVAGKGMIRP